MPIQTDNYRSELFVQLRKTIAKTYALRLASGLLTFVALGAWIFLLVIIWANASGAPPTWQALAVSRGVVIALLLLFAAAVIYPIFRVPRLRRIAFELERRRDFQDIVAAGYEFSQNPESSQRYAPELVSEVIQRAIRSVRGLQVRYLFLSRNQLFLVPVAYGALFVVLLVGLLNPDLLFEAGRRIFSPRDASAIAPRANLYGSPGNLTVLSGSDVEVGAIDFGRSQNPVAIMFSYADGFWKKEQTQQKEGAAGANLLFNRYIYTFKDLRNSTTYRFQSGDENSPDYHISVVYKPIVTELEIELTPPAYTGEKPHTLRGSGGNIQALEGTRVSVKGTANNALRAARIRFDGEGEKSIATSGRSFSFEFTALRDGSYNILLEDSLGHKTDDPLSYSVEVYRDNPPILDVLEPGDDATLPRNYRVNVAFIASDDYGLQQADIFSRKGGEDRFKRTPVPLGGERGKKEIAASYLWDLGGVMLFPGQFIEFFVQVKDNNTVTGPGVAKSRILRIYMPTMAELYDRVKEEEARRSDLLGQVIEEGQEMKNRLEKLTREFKKSEELDWSQKKEIDRTVQSQEDIQGKLTDIQKSLDETLQSLSDNRMTSQEIGEKIEQINRLIEELNNEALNEYIRKLQEAMQKMKPEEIQKALEDLNFSAEDLLDRLERTESLLREIWKEQQMEELVRKSQELMEAQKELQEETSKTDAQDARAMDALSEKQKELAEGADALQKKIDELADTVGDEEASGQLEEASKNFSKSEAARKMRQASGELSRREKQEAIGSQQEAMEALVALFGKMGSIQAQLQSASNRRAAENLQKLAKLTLDMSFKQETFTTRLREMIEIDDVSKTRALAREQQRNMRAVEQIANELHTISQRTLVVPQSLVQSLGECLSGMRNSILFLEQNKGFMSSASATQSVTALNKATMELLRASESCSSSGQGGGASASSLMQQLLAGQQKMLQESRGALAMRALQEKILQQRQAEIQRLAAQQRSLKELLDQIQKQMDENREVLGRTDKIREEMEEVIRDLEGGVLSEETLRNEERILSRLLDAQRSVHRRDYEKKRTSTTAGEIFSKASGATPEGRSLQSLREEIRRAMTLKAPGEFEDLIKLYFRALAEENPVEHGDSQH